MLVTGSGSGIGKATALRFAEEGARVVINDVDEKSLNTVTEEVRSVGAEALGIQADATNIQAVKNAVKAIIERFQRIDVLVNNVGLFTPMPFLGMKDGDWDSCMDVNLRSVFNFCRQVIPYMVEQKYGRIVNVSSSSGKVGVPNFVCYATAKHAVIGLTRSLALEFAPYNILVHAVCPGEVDTPMQKRNIETIAKTQGKVPDDYYKARVGRIPLRRYAKPEDIAKVITFLASEDAGYMTGQSVNITGGEIMH